MATIGWIKVGLTTDTTGLASGLKSSGSMLDAFVGKIGVVAPPWPEPSRPRRSAPA